jgi:N-acetylmuramoyl-L-alanine amidase
MIGAAILSALSLLACGIATAASNNCVWENFAVGIDIGHSPERPGAISARGATEFSYNRNLAKIVLENLRLNGFAQSFLIEEHDGHPSLIRRTALARQKKARLFLSIHHDSVQPQFLSRWTYHGRRLPYSDTFHGYSIFYSEKNRCARVSLEFARLLGAELADHGFVPSPHHADKITGENRELVDKQKGIYRFDDLVVLRTAEMPAVLLEAGIIVNRREETLLREPTYQVNLSRAVGRAVTKLVQRLGPHTECGLCP